MFGIALLIFFVFCLLFYILIRQNLNYWKLKGVPYIKPLPLVGNILDVVLLRVNTAVQLSKFYFSFPNVPFFGVWIFTEPHLVLKSPELIKQILIKDFDYFSDRNVQSNENVDPVSASMMFFSKNPKWRTIRTNTTPMFSSGKLKHIYPQIQKAAENMVSFIGDRTDRALEVREIATKYATDVICSIAFGIDAYSFQDGDTPFTRVGKGVFETTLRNAVASATYFCKNNLVDIFGIKFVETSIANFVSKTFLNIVKERESGNGKRRDLIELMITFKDKYHLKDHELVAQAMQFFLAGYETSSSAITNALYEISSNKDIQAKLRKELTLNMEDNGDFEYYILKNMSYLHQVVSETLRKYPPVPFLGRTCVSPYKMPNSDVVIDAGTPIMIPLMGLHYDEKYFPEPEIFDPSRFTDENIAKRDPCCYMPFGNGPRNCIGERIALLSVKMAISQIIRNFEVDLAEGTVSPLKFSAKSFLLRTSPYSIRFKKIK